MRLDGIGDALVCAPLIAALRAAGHELGIALSDRNAEIFAPGVFSARHVLERIPWPKHGSTPQSAEIARGEIALARYDAALVVSEEPEAYALARPIAQRTGFSTGWARPFKSLWLRGQLTRRVRRAQRPDSALHEVAVIFGLGQAAGLVGEAVPTRDLARLRALIEPETELLRHRGGGQLVVQLGAKWQTIGVDAASVGALVTALARRGARPIASPSEREGAAAICGDIPLLVVPDLAAWKRTIAGARALVTPDTGAAHLAGMLGVPVVDCFPDAGAAAQIARWHPWAAPYQALTARELCGSAGVARIEQAINAL